MESPLKRLKEMDREIQLLVQAGAALQWDQETYMPKAAAEERSNQIALLEGLIHKKRTSNEIGELLVILSADSSSPSLGEIDRAFVREMERLHTKLVKIPEDLVTDLARESRLAFSVWTDAREQNDYSLFSPSLKKMIDLIRVYADKIGYVDHIYDAVLDDYEPWMRTEQVRRVFSHLADELAQLVGAISERPQVRTDFLHRSYPTERQEAFGRHVLEAIGFDTQRGRLDVSAHPFSTSLGANDVRLTTRYDNQMFTSSIFGTIHEAGHGLYELGFGEDIKGTLLADGTSMGIHESQSRTWENSIGKSLAFWEHFFPKLKNYFPAQLSDVTLEEFYRGINRVEPSLIRVEADEVTYCLHIMLRFNLELQMLSGDLAVEDIPEYWNAEMTRLLGITPKTFADGALQDVHWSAGLVGYFPTYALGNLYGAQFMAKMRSEIPDLDESIGRGSFSPAVDWQRKNIHQWGRVYSASSLCERITGESLNPSYFLDYVTEKYSWVYGM